MYAAFMLIDVLDIVKTHPTLLDPELFFATVPRDTSAKASISHHLAQPVRAHPFIRSPVLNRDIPHPSTRLSPPPIVHPPVVEPRYQQRELLLRLTLVFGIANGAVLMDRVWAGLRIPPGEMEEGYEIVRQWYTSLEPSHSVL